MLVLAALLACLAAPVDAPIVDPFRPPACAWCPGNRGVDYGTRPNTPVRSVLPGVVTFAGPVVDNRYVVVSLADGRRLTYGGLLRVDVTAGDHVTVGQVLGTSTTVLHFGVRRGDTYLDPGTALAGRSRARLVRLDGRHRPPSASISCGLASAESSSRTISRLPPAVA